MTTTKKTTTRKPSPPQQGTPIVIEEAYYPTEPLKYDEPCSSRGFFITLRPHKDNMFTNKDEEVAKLTEYVKSFTGFKYAIIGREHNYYKNYATNSSSEDSYADFVVEEEGYHYHIMIITSIPAKERKKQKITESIISLFPENIFPDQSVNVRFMDSNQRRVMGYVCKDGDYITIGDIAKEFIENTVKIYNTEKNKRLKQKFKSSDEREEAAIQFVIDLMKRENIKVNYYTDEFMNFGKEKEFWGYLVKKGFLDLFSRKDLELVQRMIKNDVLYSAVFPYYNPHMSMFKYTDCYLDLQQSKILTLEEGRQLLSVTNQDPVLEFDVPFTREIPILYREYVSRFADPEQFKKVFREVLCPVVKGGRCLYMYGPTGTGKTVMYDLFKYIFRNVIKNYANDDRFSWSSIAKCPKFAIDECDLYTSRTTTEIKNQYKKLLNGDTFSVAQKHSSAIECIPKNGIITSNNTPFPKNIPRDEQVHYDALNRRLYIHHVYQQVEVIDLDFTDRIFDEIPKIIADHIDD